MEATITKEDQRYLSIQKLLKQERELLDKLKDKNSLERELELRQSLKDVKEELKQYKKKDYVPNTRNS